MSAAPGSSPSLPVDSRSGTAPCRCPGWASAMTACKGGLASRATRWCSTTCSLRSGGTLAITGSVRLEDFSRPVLDLGFRAEAFRAIDVRNFLTLTGTGRLGLRGPLFRPPWAATSTANSGVLYFADLVNKRIIDLEDPTIADLVDTTLLRQAESGMRQVPEPVPRLPQHPQPAGGDGLRRLASLGRGQHPAGRRSAAEQDRQDLHSFGHAGSAAGQLHPQDRTGDPRLHGGPRIGSLLRRSQRRPGHRRNPRRARRAGRRDSGHREHHRHAVRAQAHAGEHLQPADLGDRPGLLPGHRLSGERGRASGAGRRARRPASPISPARCRASWSAR